MPDSTAITRMDLRRVVARSFWLQAAWNYRGLQNLGFLFALAPALRKIYPQARDRRHAYRRYTAYFHTHPYFASFLLGLAVRVEEERSRLGARARVQEEEDVMRYVAGPFSAIGDALFWGSLRPLTALIGLMIVFFAGDDLRAKLAGPLVFLLLYNFAHFYYRSSGVFRGYRSGEKILRQVSGGYYLRLINYVHLLGYLLIGTLSAYYCHRTAVRWADLLDLASFSFLVAVLLFYLGLRRGYGPTRLIYLSLVIVILIGWLGG